MYWGSALTKPVQTKPSKHSDCQATCEKYWLVIATSVLSRPLHRTRARLLTPRIFHGRTAPGFWPQQPHLFVLLIAVTQRGTMPYRCIASSPEGLVQQVAVSYLRHGYWWYVTGRIPNGKDPESVDRKLIGEIRDRPNRPPTRLPQETWSRQHAIHPLRQLVPAPRHGRPSLVQTTRTKPHPRLPSSSDQVRRVFNQLPPRWRHTNRAAASPNGTPVSASILGTYRELKAFFLNRACHRSVENLASDFARVPYARFAPVRRQLLTIQRSVNSARARVGHEPIPHSVLKLRRKILQPFDSGCLELGRHYGNRQLSSSPRSHDRHDP